MGTAELATDVMALSGVTETMVTAVVAATMQGAEVGTEEVAATVTDDVVVMQGVAVVVVAQGVVATDTEVVVKEVLVVGVAEGTVLAASWLGRLSCNRK